MPVTGTWAQQAANDAIAEGEGRLGGRIVVTAGRRETNLQETPLSILALSNDMVEARGIDDLQDLARFAPNLSITPAISRNCSSPGSQWVRARQSTGRRAIRWWQIISPRAQLPRVVATMHLGMVAGGGLSLLLGATIIYTVVGHGLAPVVTGLATDYLFTSP